MTVSVTGEGVFGILLDIEHDVFRGVENSGSRTSNYKILGQPLAILK